MWRSRNRLRQGDEYFAWVRTLKLPHDLLEPRDQPPDQMRHVLKPMAETALFFHAIAPVLVANVLTVAFLYAFVKINQKGRGEKEGRGTYLRLIVLVNLFILCGLYTWGVYPLKY
jgi:hypothetical protein